LHVVLIGLLVGAGLLVGWQAAELIAAGKAGGRKALPLVSSESPEPPLSTAVLPKNRTILHVDLRSRGAAGAKEATGWDGQLTVSGGGRLVAVRSWTDDPRDIIDGSSWKVTTRRAIPYNTEQRAKGHDLMPLQDSALRIELADAAPDTQLEFKTQQGNFGLRLSDVPFGTTKKSLNGLAEVKRMANSGVILSAPTEDDFPAAAAAPNGSLYVAYAAFVHGKDFRVRGPLAEEPKDLSNLAEPTGGEQVMLLRLDGDQWTGPMPVTPAGQDVFHPAIAVDGQGGVWVFWSAKKDGAWDLFARQLKGEAWSPELRLTSTPGPDIFPAAATDRAGRVWVAWQAFRSGHSDILAVRQDGDRFGPPMVVAEGPGNKWEPAIAASSDGQVAVAWDTYQNGNYDVSCRIATGDKWAEPVTVANSLEAEMRPSLTYDHAGRLWIAYETAPERWGKDWGALAKTGVPLYQGRSVAVRVLDQGRLMAPAESAAAPFAPAVRAKRPVKGGGQLTTPRLVTDARGRVWLSVRRITPGVRVNVGGIWFDHLTFYEGNRWSDEIICPATDNTLDSRPSLVPRPDGQVLVIAASDGRMATGGQLPQWFIKALRDKGEKVEQHPIKARWPDPVNNELTMAEVGPAPGAAPAAPVLEPVTLPAAPPADPEAKKEADAVAAARAVRVTVDGKPLRLLRGEFHRHTEWSPDGQGDGMLMDMWRYAFDTASEDWVGNGDHDNGNGREYSWWLTQKTTDIFFVPGATAPMFTYERSVSYPDGHRNVVFAQRGVRTLPRLQGGMGKAMDDLPADAERPHSPDTLLLYRYLGQFDGVCASHTSGTDMGTDWRDNNPKVEPVVEIYQGCRQNYEVPGAPRSNTEGNSIGGWRPLGFVSLALKKGYCLGFQSSSDHGSTHISYCNVWATDVTREAILAAMKARHVYGATDNIIAVMKCGEHFMGDEFTLGARPVLNVRLTGTGPFAKVHVIKDSNYVHTLEPNKAEVEFQWTDMDVQPGKTAYYYVRGEQANGELVWISPMWIAYKP
jgi:hypothetical protein